MLSTVDLERLIAEKRREINMEKSALGLSPPPADNLHIEDLETDGVQKPRKTVTISAHKESGHEEKDNREKEQKTAEEIPAELERYIRRYLGLPVMLKAGEFSPNNPILRAERHSGDVLLGLGEYERRRNTLRKIRQQQYREYLDQQAKKKQEEKAKETQLTRELEEKERKREDERSRLRKEIEKYTPSPEQRRSSVCYVAGDKAPSVQKSKVDTGIQVSVTKPLSVAVQTEESNLYPLSAAKLTTAERELSPRTVTDRDQRDQWDQNRDSRDQWDQNRDPRDQWDQNRDSRDQWDQNRDSRNQWDQNRDSKDQWDQNRDILGQPRDQRCDRDHREHWDQQRDSLQHKEQPRDHKSDDRDEREQWDQQRDSLDHKERQKDGRDQWDERDHKWDGALSGDGQLQAHQSSPSRNIQSNRSKLVNDLRHTYMPSILDADAIRTRNLQAEKEAAERKQFYQQELKNQIQEQQRIRDERKAREKMLEQAEMRRLDEQLRMLRMAQEKEVGRQQDITNRMKHSSTVHEIRRNGLQREIDFELQKLRAKNIPIEKRLPTSKSENGISNLPFYYPDTSPRKKTPYSTNIPENSIFSPTYDLDSYLRKNLNPSKEDLFSNRLDTIASEAQNYPYNLENYGVDKICEGIDKIGESFDKTGDGVDKIVDGNYRVDQMGDDINSDLRRNSTGCQRKIVVEKAQIHEQPKEKSEKPSYEPSILRKEAERRDDTPIPVLRHSPKLQNVELNEDLSEKMRLVDDKWKVPAVQKNILKTLPSEEGKSVSILTQLGSIRRQLQMEQMRLDNLKQTGQ